MDMWVERRVSYMLEVQDKIVVIEVPARVCLDRRAVFLT